jgi:hypothetical protein
VRPEGLGTFKKKSPHRLSNQQPSGLQLPLRYRDYKIYSYFKNGKYIHGLTLQLPLTPGRFLVLTSVQLYINKNKFSEELVDHFLDMTGTAYKFKIRGRHTDNIAIS